MGLFGKNNTENAAGPANFEVYMSNELKLKKTEVGIKRAKELNGKISVMGIVKSGTFVAGDEVAIVSNGVEIQAVIYGVYQKVESMSVEELISTGSRRKGLTEGMEGYIALDLDAAEFPKDSPEIEIVKK